MLQKIRFRIDDSLFNENTKTNEKLIMELLFADDAAAPVAHADSTM